MKIVYTGPLSPGETCEMRREALERLGCQTVPVDYLPLTKKYRGLNKKIQWHLRMGPLISTYNQLIVNQLKDSPDMLWVDKGIFVWDSVIQAAKRRNVRFVVHYSPDNYFLRQNSSRHFWKCLPFYDLVVTTKTGNVPKLQERGARSVFLSGNAYDPTIHRLMSLSAEERKEYDCDVSFIGRWEPERERWLEKVAALNVRLSIRGYHWERTRSSLAREARKGGPVLGECYAKAICGARINLVFLSRLAKDQITQRSVEIPACGGFMLAERTSEHLAHFDEDREAVYFTGPEDMCAKILYYLRHEKERQRIAAAGRSKCLAAGFSYDERLRQILARLGTNS